MHLGKIAPTVHVRYLNSSGSNYIEIQDGRGMRDERGGRGVNTCHCHHQNDCALWTVAGQTLHDYRTVPTPACLTRPRHRFASSIRPELGAMQVTATVTNSRTTGSLYARATHPRFALGSTTTPPSEAGRHAVKHVYVYLFVDRYYVALFSSLGQTRCASM